MSTFTASEKRIKDKTSEHLTTANSEWMGCAGKSRLQSIESNNQNKAFKIGSLDHFLLTTVLRQLKSSAGERSNEKSNENSQATDKFPADPKKGSIPMRQSNRTLHHHPSQPDASEAASSSSDEDNSVCRVPDGKAGASVLARDASDDAENNCLDCKQEGETRPRPRRRRRLDRSGHEQRRKCT